MVMGANADYIVLLISIESRVLFIEAHSHRACQSGLYSASVRFQASTQIFYGCVESIA